MGMNGRGRLDPCAFIHCFSLSLSFFFQDCFDSSDADEMMAVSRTFERKHWKAFVYEDHKHIIHKSNHVFLSIQDAARYEVKHHGYIDYIFARPYPTVYKDDEDDDDDVQLIFTECQAMCEALPLVPEVCI